MSNKNSYTMSATYPFVRFSLSKNTDSHLYAPEIALILAAGLSYVFWPVDLTGFDTWLLFVIWVFISGSLISLALTNMKYLLLPDRMLKTLIISVSFYVLTAAALASQAQSGSAGDIILTSLAGVLVLGLIPYILFQVSSGRWIGGGDVKLGAILGLLLGWKLALIALAAHLVLTYLIIFIIGVTQYRLPGKLQVIPSGFIWAIVAIGTFVLGNYFI